jgi:hypothetical protein
MAAAVWYYRPKEEKPVLTSRSKPVSVKKPVVEWQWNVKTRSSLLKKLADAKGYSTRYAFFINMNIPSGKNRFFAIDLTNDSIIAKGLVAHGSCNQWISDTPAFSNEPNTGCSSLGFYKIGYPYQGRFGKAYKLYGLDTTNSNAFRRYVVLHAYDCVPDDETYPADICNSLGCPMVSYNFLRKIATLIDASPKPVLLWMVNEP